MKEFIQVKSLMLVSTVNSFMNFHILGVLKFSGTIAAKITPFNISAFCQIRRVRIMFFSPYVIFVNFILRNFHFIQSFPGIV